MNIYTNECAPETVPQLTCSWALANALIYITLHVDTQSYAAPFSFGSRLKA